MNYYQGGISDLSSAELGKLQTEIEDSGALSKIGEVDWGEDDWERQAYLRDLEISRELERRWDLEHPEAADRKRKHRSEMVPVIAAQLDVARPKLQEMFEHHQNIERLFQGKSIRYLG